MRDILLAVSGTTDICQALTALQMAQLVKMQLRNEDECSGCDQQKLCAVPTEHTSLWLM